MKALINRTSSARKSNKLSLFLLLIIFTALSSFVLLQNDKNPTLYIIGDSTVRNGDGSGRNGQWGWGSFLAQYFDTTKINIRNHAIGGRSSRTFITEGRWDSIKAHLKQGDYVLIQFGHNDSGPLDDSARARGTISGIGDETREINNPITHQVELVHTYGWYLTKYVTEAQALGAVPIVCSPIPRNDWKDGKVVRSTDSYAGWAQRVAKEHHAYFVDLNSAIAARYETMGPEAVKAFFPADHTHTNLEGAKLNAEIVIAQLKDVKPENLKRYYKP